MHYEVADYSKSSSSVAFFEVLDKCQVLPMKELPPVTCSNSGQAFVNSQMSFKITVSNGGDNVEMQHSPPELPMPLLDFFPKRPSIFERLPMLQKTQETLCLKSGREYFQPKVQDNLNQTCLVNELVISSFQKRQDQL
uniref:Uncharacterized protein n=1 Tax=Sphaerodactylus townsendi TaxID=933632 RepID=A0ACB8F4S3_9SAUR